MTFLDTNNPLLAVSLALAFGILAQAVARHLAIPGIILLLATGVVLGPEVLGLVQPSSLGQGLHGLVGFSVSIILFEGALNLNLRRLRRSGLIIRRLVTEGALITGAGAAVAAFWILDWDLRLSVLFGSLVVVTGPTVMTPILKRVRIKKGLSTILEAEGVLIDAVGAIAAVVVLEVVLGPLGSEGMSWIEGLLQVVLRLVFGAVMGLVGGAIDRRDVPRSSADSGVPGKCFYSERDLCSVRNQRIPGS